VNLANLIIEAQRLAGRVDTGYNDRTRRWINEALDQWAISVPWPTLNRTETFIATGDRTLVLPPRVHTVRWIGDKANQATLFADKHWEREYPGELYGNTAGQAFLWRDAGSVATTRQPASASVLRVDTTASDSFNVYIAGLAEDTSASGTADHYYAIEEQLVVGSSSTYSSAHSYVQVDILGKDDFTPADVSVRDSAGLLARINAHRYTSEYRQVEFLMIPGAGTQLPIQYIHRPAPLIENYQVPPPSVEPEYLIWYAAGLIHAAQAGQEQEAQIKRARADEILQKRIYKERTHGGQDYRAIPEQGYWANEDQYIVPDN
jgi:hypothetical protein